MRSPSRAWLAVVLLLVAPLGIMPIAWADGHADCHKKGNETICDEPCVDEKKSSACEPQCHDEKGNVVDCVETCYDEAWNEVPCYDVCVDETGAETVCYDMCSDADGYEVSCYDTCYDEKGNETACYDTCYDEKGNEAPCHDLCSDEKNVAMPCEGDCVDCGPMVDLTLQFLAPDGKPVADLIVVLLREEGEYYQDATDAKGVVLFAGVPAGLWRYLAEPEMDMPYAYTEGLLDLESKEDVEIAYEIYLEAATVIRGSLVDASGKPVAAYIVAAEIADACGDFDAEYYDDGSFDEKFYDEKFSNEKLHEEKHLDAHDLDEKSDEYYDEFETFDDGCGMDYVWTETKKDGSFLLLHATGGYYDVFAELHDGRVVTLAHQAYVLPQQENDLGKHVVREPGAVKGTLRADGDIGEAWVYLADHYDAVHYALVEKGAFLLEGIEEGDYLLFVESALAPLEMKVSVQGGKTTDLGVIELDDGLSVSGLVTSGSKPVADAYVALFDAEGYGGDATTDGKGHFHIGGLAPGSYGYYVAGEDFWFEVMPHDANAIVVKDDVVVDLAAPALSTISGVVRDANGKPLAGAVVLAHGNGAGDYAWTDEKGHYLLRLPAGVYTIEAEDAEGELPYFYARDAVKLSAGASETYDVKFGSGGNVLKGNVTHEGGKPAKDALVLLLALDAKDEVLWVDSTTTDARGAWSFDSVPDGTYLVVALDGDLFSSETRITMEGADKRAPGLVLREADE